MNPAPLLASLHQMWCQVQVALPDAQPLPWGQVQRAVLQILLGRAGWRCHLVGEGSVGCSPLLPSHDRNGTQGAQPPAPRLHTVPSGPESRARLTSGESEDEYQGQSGDLGPTGHTALTVLTGVSPFPPVSSASAPPALLNTEIRGGDDSPTAAQILRLTQNPRRKTPSEMTCPNVPHAPCTLIQGTWSVV